MAAGETPALLLQDLHVVRSAVVSTAGTRASSPECFQSGRSKFVDVVFA
jgi:hypothetical protein